MSDQQSGAPPFHGEIKCQALVKATGKPCTNFAYSEDGGAYKCNVHAKKATRKELGKNPRAAEIALREQQLREAAALRAAAANAAQQQRGRVICTKFRPRKKVAYVDGYTAVFPNRRHQNRSDGIGCSSLSPMCMGPVEHGQPGLPPALSIENFHQFGKVFPSELDEKGEPASAFFETQLVGYRDPAPHRHKPTADSAIKSKNIPAYAVWKRRDGTLVKCSYIESRQFYCTFYERLSAGLPDLAHLRALIAAGHNLQIVGYDANNDLAPENVDEWYLNPAKPFGHESVLFAILTVPEDRWPWRTRRTEDF